MTPVVRHALLALAAGTCLEAASQAAAPRRSGYEDMSPATQAMQRDDAANPALLWVKEGEALWQRKPSAGRPSCADCHGAAATSMRGVAARHPAWSERHGRALTLAQRIDDCRVRHQSLPPAGPDGDATLALASHVALQSRGLPIAPPDDARLQPWRERGAAWFGRRLGQLDLACVHCHDERAGRRLGGSPIPQGHPTGYPLYRLEWQALGSLQRRLRACIGGVRAAPFAPDAPEWVELELHLMQRAAGMPMDAPAVRP